MGFARFNRLVLQRVRTFLRNRNISTSKNNQDTAAVAEACKTSKVGDKNWISYGYERRDKELDRLIAHITMFGGISVCLVGGTYLMMYSPDVTQKDWAQREAFIELRYRERACLPLVDPNLVDPACIKLPSDEELGETEIII